MLSAAALATLMGSSLFVGILICVAQLRLALRIIRAKTDVPIFNQLFVLCLGVSGLSSINSYCTGAGTGAVEYLVDAMHLKILSLEFEQSAVSWQTGPQEISKALGNRHRRGHNDHQVWPP